MIYMLLFGETKGENVAVRVYYKPMISFLWIGCIITSIGGLLAAINIRRKNNNLHA